MAPLPQKVQRIGQQVDSTLSLPGCKGFLCQREGDGSPDSPGHDSVLIGWSLHNSPVTVPNNTPITEVLRPACGSDLLASDDILGFGEIDTAPLFLLPIFSECWPTLF